MNNKYIKKSVEIEAIQWNGINLSEIQEFGKGNLDIDIYNNGVTPPLVTIEIKTLEGVMKLNEDDYLIKGIKGEYYPCKPDIFELTYEKVYTLEEVKQMWEEAGWKWKERDDYHNGKDYRLYFVTKNEYSVYQPRIFFRKYDNTYYAFEGYDTTDFEGYPITEIRVLHITLDLQNLITKTLKVLKEKEDVCS